MNTNGITIGASQSPALFGFGSPIALYERLVNGPSEDEPKPEWLEWGTRAEPIIVEKYAELHPLWMIRSNDESVAHPSCQCMHATPDGYVHHDDRGIGVLEVKNTGHWMAQRWTDGIPGRHKIQVQHQMACTGHGWGAVAVLIGGNQFREGELERDEILIEEIEKRCCAMVKRVTNLDPPPADGSDEAGQALARLYPLETTDVIQFSGEAIEWTARLDQLRVDAAANKAETDELRAKIKAEIGDAKAGVLPSGRAWRWATKHRSAALREACQDLLDAFWDMSPLEYALSRELRDDNGLVSMSDAEGERIKDRARTAVLESAPAKSYRELRMLKGIK